MDAAKILENSDLSRAESAIYLAALGLGEALPKALAEKAGIKEFDIITECNGEKITDKNPLSHILQKCKIGGETIFKILRDKKEVSLKVKLEEKT